MKRKVNILACCLLLGALLLTACHDYDGYDYKEIGLSQAERLANADSLYLNLSITNSAGVTRAPEPEYEVGSAAENAIYDGILCIFEGTDDATATLRSAVAIDQLISNPYEPQRQASGSETSINITQRLKNTHPYAAHVYAAVLLNTTRSGFFVEDGKLYFRTETTDPNTEAVTFVKEDLTGATFSIVTSYTINDVGNTDRHVGLFMTNAELVQITPDNHLFDTEKDAADNFEAGHIEIHVARAAAKVTIHSALTSGDNITNITLNNTTTKAKFHTMRWMLTPEPGYIDIDFTDFHQQALKSDEVVYVKPGSGFSVVVELQVKDGSFLIDEAYKYQSGSDIRFYTNLQPLIEYLMEGWTNTHHNNYSAISTRTAAEVFRHPTFYINDNGSVNMTLTNDSFTGEGEQGALVSLAGTLKGLLTGYRDAKMYFTYAVGNLAANNSYTLTFEDSSITGIGRPTPTPPTP